MKNYSIKKDSNILGYKVYSGTIDECMKEILSREKVHVVSGNPEVLFNGTKDKELFNNFISKDSLIIPDGVGTKLASRIVKKSITEKIAGIDVMKKIIEYCENRNKSIYLLGTSEESLKLCVENLMKEYPKLNICGYHNGFFKDEESKEILEEIKGLKPKVLFVAMGSPRQEKFIAQYMNELPINIFMGVGGSFDIFAGKLQRAPKWIINIGLEWAYRVIKEPWRIKRLNKIPKFLYLVWKNRSNDDER